MDWFEDENFWRELYPYMFTERHLAAAPEQVEQVLALVQRGSGAVLDLCCGPGRHAVELARRGFRVTGVDRSPFLLGKARERAAGAGVTVEWIEEDMRRFRRPSAFDLACSMYTSFGYFAEEEDDLRVLRNVHESLGPGGSFLIDVISKERVARNWQNALCTDFEDGAVVVQRPKVRDDWRRIENEWILIKDGRARSYRFEHTIYSGRELSDRLLQAGFAEVRLCGDLQGAAYGLDAPRLIAVARKA
jgi:SAM-dependent methyltransferase